MTSGKHGYTSTLHQVSVGPNAHGCLKTPESEWSKVCMYKRALTIADLHIQLWVHPSIRTYILSANY